MDIYVAGLVKTGAMLFYVMLGAMFIEKVIVRFKEKKYYSCGVNVMLAVYVMGYMIKIAFK